MDMHANQLAVSLETVRELVDAQFPGWQSLPIRPVERLGTVHAIFRIGDRLAARFPLQGDDVESTRRRLEAEARAALRTLERILADESPDRSEEPTSSSPVRD